MSGTDIRMTHVQSRRGFLVGGLATGAAMMAAPTLAQEVAAGTILNSISAFNLVDWCDHFDSLKSCVIIADTGARVVQFWSPDENVHKVSPSSVSLGDDLTRLSYN